MESKTSIDLKISTDNSFLEDDIKESIVEYGENFVKLYDFIGGYSKGTSLFEIGKMYDNAVRIWNDAPAIGEYVGWVNLRRGVYAPEREVSKNYSKDDLVTSPNQNGYYYKCIENGKTDTSTPLFSTSSNAEFFDVQASQWQGQRNYNVNDTVVSRDGSQIFYFICETAGFSGIGEPNWNNVATGTTVIDGSVVWRKEKNVKWRRMASSCHFRPFGKIE